MRKLIVGLCLFGVFLVSCKKECDSGIMFFEECIETSGKSIYTSEYKTDFCHVSLLFEITYGQQIDIKKYQFSHSHDPSVHWTLASNVKVGQRLNGGVNCEKPKEVTPELTHFFFTVPDEASSSFPVTIKRLTKSFETLDSTVVIFNRN